MGSKSLAIEASFHVSGIHIYSELYRLLLRLSVSGRFYLCIN